MLRLRGTCVEQGRDRQGGRRARHHALSVARPRNVLPRASMTSTVAHTVITADGATPTRAMLFLHGIFGSGANWRTFAKRLVTARPDWCAVLVDLRMHGASQSLPPPHTVEAAAQDLESLSSVLNVPIRGVVGHSFGGKVALAFVAKHAATLDEAWILDSMPGDRESGRGSETTLAVLRTLATMGTRFASRDAFIDQLVGAGIGRSIAQWLAMNLRNVGDAYELRLDLGAITALLEDYLVVDLWSAIEKAPASLEVHVVVGGKSRVYSAEDRERVERLAKERPQRVWLHVLEKAGHWVHVDDPEGLFGVMTGATTNG